MTYLLDANVFISAKNLHYGLDFCPAFWDWLVAGNKSERVFSVEKVGDELQALGDELSEWAAKRGNGFFLPPDDSVFPAMAEISAWASGHTVVTHEVPSASTRKIKIPNACIGLGIKCMTPYEMLRLERARFVLGTTP